MGIEKDWRIYLGRAGIITDQHWTPCRPEQLASLLITYRQPAQFDCRYGKTPAYQPHSQTAHYLQAACTV